METGRPDNVMRNEDALEKRAKDSMYFRNPEVDLLKPYNDLLREKRLDGAIAKVRQRACVHDFRFKVLPRSRFTAPPL